MTATTFRTALPPPHLRSAAHAAYKATHVLLTADGRLCCSAEDASHLCADCAAALAPAPPPQAPPRAAVAPQSTTGYADPPPSWADRLRHADQRPVAARASAAAGCADPPPSMADHLRAKRS
jgi:hypothetical protein